MDTAQSIRTIEQRYDEAKKDRRIQNLFYQMWQANMVYGKSTADIEMLFKDIVDKTFKEVLDEQQNKSDA